MEKNSKATVGSHSFRQSFRIGTREVGAGCPPYLVAEMSGNHNRSLERALKIVDAAADAGAHAIKLQTYTADSMTVDVKREPFVINDPDSLWNGRSLYDLYAEAATPYEWHAPIMERARSRGLDCFSTPFDEAAVDFLESLNVPAFKIASFELVDLPLIKRVAATGKPMIMSTGMATLAEIHNAVEFARAAGCRDLILLKCTSTYPATPEDSNIVTIPHLKDAFGSAVGISDHTMGVGVSVAAVALGASFIEKHFTLARSEGGVDSAFSMEPAEFRILTDESLRAWQGLGKVTYARTRGEKASLLYRRSVMALRDIRLGEELTRENIGIKRPGHGLKPSEFEMVLGKRASRQILAGEGISWEMV